MLVVLEVVVVIVEVAVVGVSTVTCEIDLLALTYMINMINTYHIIYFELPTLYKAN